MAAAEGGADAAAKGAPDARCDWISARIVSSLKARDEQVVKLLQGDSRCESMRAARGHPYIRPLVAGGAPRTGLPPCAPAPPRFSSAAHRPCAHRAAVEAFLDEPDVRRLLVFSDGKDLSAVGCAADGQRTRAGRPAPARLCSDVRHGSDAGQLRACITKHSLGRCLCTMCSSAGCTVRGSRHMRTLGPARIPPSHVPQSNKPLQRFKRKALYFVKSHAARVEPESISKAVSWVRAAQPPPS